MFSNLVRSPFLYVSLAAVLGGWIFFHPRHEASAALSPTPDGQPRPVLVELFTSEGCSSCPPADALLKRLSEQQPLEGVHLIALEEHVDYWNHLGWVDPFSSLAYSDRQDEYARSLGTGSVYTPQMVVDGQFEVVGSRGEEALKTILKAAAQPKLEITIQRSDKSTPEKPTLTVQVSNPQGLALRDSADLWVAITETNLQSDVKAGENSGEQLKHAAVVRSLRKIETLHDLSGYKGDVTLGVDGKWKRDNLSAVIIVSDRKSHKVIGAASATLAPQS